MSKPLPATLVFPFVSAIYNRNFENLNLCFEKLTPLLGQNRIEFESTAPQTHYYQNEMGDNLRRKFCFGTIPIARENLVGIKLLCLEIETEFVYQNSRLVNLDPGILALESVILATFKPYSHRIYLAQGVWAELVYRYKANTFGTFEWTYPDYKNATLIELFNQQRQFLKKSVSYNKD